jgi:hypothetical protein
MTDRSDWVLTHLDPHTSPAVVTRTANRIAAARGLPMVLPQPAPGVQIRGVALGERVLMHPEVHAEWQAQAGGIRPKNRAIAGGRRKATGKARRKGGA